MSLASYHCSTPGSVPLFGGRSSGFRLAAAMAFERPRQRELSELVPHHILGHKHLDEQPAVVNQERVADKIRHNGTIARPGLDRLAMAGLLPLHLVQQAKIYVRPFFDGTTHRKLPSKAQLFYSRNDHRPDRAISEH